MAFIYRAARLLPAGHPYLDPANAGRFGVIHVIGQAYGNLRFRKDSIDQVAIFFVLLTGIVLLAVQFMLLAVSFFFSPAIAGSMGDFLRFFFVTQDPTYDLVYAFMDRTFGIPDLYGSCVSQGVPCRLDISTGTASGAAEHIPNGFHNGMHKLFEFYNIGILAIGAIILLYFAVVIVAETAHDGTPFGRRFNHAWAPVRLFLAIGLLTPLTLGFSGAQLTALYVAKWGSSAATNGWNYFTEKLSDHTPVGSAQNLVAIPAAPAMNSLPEFMFVATVCAISQKRIYSRDIKGYVVGGGNNGDFRDLNGLSFDEARDFAVKTAQTGDITIRFGERDENGYKNFEGYVRPFCGDITIPVRDYNEPAAKRMQESYLQIIQSLWYEGGQNGDFLRYANAVADQSLSVGGDAQSQQPDKTYISNMLMAIKCLYKPDDLCRTSEMSGIMGSLGGGGGGNGIIDEARQQQIDNGKWMENYSKLGWGGAAIWYNKIAQVNGAFVSSVFGVPIPAKYPEVMESVMEQRRQKNSVVNGKERFNPVLSDGKMVDFETKQDIPIAIALYHAQTLWLLNYEKTGGNPFLDTIAAIFGLQGLFNIRENIEVSPLAQISAIGRSLVESAVVNLGFSFAAGVAGGLGSILNLPLVSTVGTAAAGLAKKVAMIGLSIGFILFYIVPFLPFMYFFLAVGGWVKAIFEAMVGLPLWALAHVRIDGEGVPGPVAMDGYYLLFEIFLRPLLIVLGLIGGAVVFSAQVSVLNMIWDVVTTNVTGADNVMADTTGVPGPNGSATLTVGTVEYLRGYADQLFHTVIYTVAVYMIGMASFKLVDAIPKHVMQWMGASVETTTEQIGDPAAQLVQYAFGGSQLLLNQSSGAFSRLLGRNS